MAPRESLWHRGIIHENNYWLIDTALTTSKSENHMQNSDGMQNACGVNGTTCTIDEQFERPWQP
jgi:hypothetical protein